MFEAPRNPDNYSITAMHLVKAMTAEAQAQTRVIYIRLIVVEKN